MATLTDIGAVFVISLHPEKSKRLELFKKKFKQRSQLEITVVPAVDGETIVANQTKLGNGTFACLLSHIFTLDIAESTISKNNCILVFEDDASICDNFDSKLNEAMMQLPKNWDMLWLCGYDRVKSESYSSELGVLKNSLGAYAYMLNGHAIEFFANKLKQEKMACDDTFAKYQSKLLSFRTAKKLVAHGHTRSQRLDIDNKTKDK